MNISFLIFFFISSAYPCEKHKTLIWEATQKISKLENSAETIAPLPSAVSEIVPRPLRPLQSELISIIPDYKEEHIRPLKLMGRDRPVTYLAPHQSKKFQVRFGNDGKLYDFWGKPVSTSAGIRVDAKGIKVETGSAIFVMDKLGNLYLSTYQEQGVFHHSSLIAGGDAYALGEIKVENGKITYANPKSGHYLPDGSSLNRFKKRLQQIWNASIVNDIKFGHQDIF